MAAAIEITGPGEPPVSEAEQLPLLPDMRPKPDPDRQEAEVSGERGPGRPPGARNKRTQKMVEYITNHYGSPLDRLAQLYSADPAELAKKYKIKIEHALELMKSAAVAALPYVEQKRPISVDIEGKGTFQLIIGDVGQGDLDQANEEGFSVVIDAQAELVEDDEKDQGKSDA